VRLVIEAFGKRVVDLELMAPLRSPPAPDPPVPPPPPAHDTRSTTASQVEQADDGVHAPFGFAPVIKAGPEASRGRDVLGQDRRAKGHGRHG
jgi:hypothetical protein